MGLPVERSPDLEATSRGLAILQLVATDKASMEEFSKVRAKAEIFRDRPSPNLGEEYRKWKKLTGLLKSSKESFLAE
jgi:glycerol kinase